MNTKVFITAAGKFLPGHPVSNSEIEEYLGYVNGKPSRTKEKILKQNGIKTRYYALDKNQNTIISNSKMAANAIDDCLQKSEVNNKKTIDFLAAATTQGDLPVPGFASMVHADSGIGNCEIATLHGVCSSSMMAIKSAFLQVKSDNKTNAIVCGSEMPSRMFKASHFNDQNSKNLNLETDFLRWMLSDGAGALMLQPSPNKTKLSLEIEWIELTSFANQFDVCMYTGANKDKEGHLEKSWLDYPNFYAANKAGAINLKQDLKLVNNIVKLGVDGFFRLISKGKI
jgi:3-oxoacyl-[acyl-carrier-protein] synthase-3